MGQQQLLLIILGVIIVGIAIAVGISQFGAHSTQANKDGVTSGLINAAANAYQFKIRPKTMGGGGGKYDSYALPSRMSSDDNGAYTVITASGPLAQIQGTSSINSTWSATCSIDSNGITTMSYSGW